MLSARFCFEASRRARCLMVIGPDAGFFNILGAFPALESAGNRAIRGSAKDPPGPRSGLLTPLRGAAGAKPLLSLARCRIRRKVFPVEAFSRFSFNSFSTAPFSRRFNSTGLSRAFRRPASQSCTPPVHPGTPTASPMAYQKGKHPAVITEKNKKGRLLRRPCP
jgi:hypothetical protein